MLVCSGSSAKAQDKERKTLSDISQVLARGGYSTRVPKGAVLHSPERLKERIVAKPEGKYISWKEFLRKNRSWIYLQEVTMEQASGKDKINQRVVRHWYTVNKMVISVNNGDLVSVKPKAYASEEENS